MVMYEVCLVLVGLRVLRMLLYLLRSVQWCVCLGIGSHGGSSFDTNLRPV